MKKEIKVEPSGLTSLAGVRTQRHLRYLAEEHPDGTIILTPAVSVLAMRIRPENLLEQPEVKA